MENGKDRTAETEELVLENGLKLTMQLPTGSNYLVAIELGGDSQIMMQVFESLLCVRAINGDAQVSRNRLQLDALANRLGRRGVDEVGEWFQRKQYPELFAIMAEMPGATKEEIGAEAERRRVAKLKNSQETA